MGISRSSIQQGTWHCCLARHRRAGRPSVQPIYHPSKPRAGLPGGPIWRSAPAFLFPGLHGGVHSHLHHAAVRHKPHHVCRERIRFPGCQAGHVFAARHAPSSSRRFPVHPVQREVSRRASSSGKLSATNTSFPRVVITTGPSGCAEYTCSTVRPSLEAVACAAVSFFRPEYFRPRLSAYSLAKACAVPGCARQQGKRAKAISNSLALPASLRCAIVPPSRCRHSTPESNCARPRRRQTARSGCVRQAAQPGRCRKACKDLSTRG